MKQITNNKNSGVKGKKNSAVIQRGNVVFDSMSFMILKPIHFFRFFLLILLLFCSASANPVVYSPEMNLLRQCCINFGVVIVETLFVYLVYTKQKDLVKVFACLFAANYLSFLWGYFYADSDIEYALAGYIVEVPFYCMILKCHIFNIKRYLPVILLTNLVSTLFFIVYIKFFDQLIWPPPAEQAI